MDRNKLENLFSTERLRKFYAAYPTDDSKALAHYQCNILISEAFYPCLSVLEVALRNAINRQLTTFFGTSEWYSHFSTTAGLSTLLPAVNTAQKHITKRGELINAPKIVAELSLGFWVTLFNIEYELILWKPLRKAFPNMPKATRQRKNVSAPLNNFRLIRNRIFHNEPICWNLAVLKEKHSQIIETLKWIDPEIPHWLASMDRFDTVLDEVKRVIR